MTPETTLGQIVAMADLFEAGGGRWLLAPATPELVDTLAMISGPGTRTPSPMTSRSSMIRPRSTITTRSTATTTWDTDSRWPHRHQLMAPLRRGFLSQERACR